jgi:hypothetical protein
LIDLLTRTNTKTLSNVTDNELFNDNRWAFRQKQPN